MSDIMLTEVLESGVAVLRLDDGKANALSHAMIARILAAVATAERESAAVVIAGRPGMFSAGYDLKEVKAGRAPAIAMLRRGAELTLALFEAKVPLVIASTGHALAGGALLALAGDLRIGAAGPYKYGFNEVAIQLALPTFAVELARHRLSPRELTRATMLATIYDPPGALAAGFLDEVVEADQVVARAVLEAERLAKLPKVAFRDTKARARAGLVARIQETLEEDLEKLDIPSM